MLNFGTILIQRICFLPKNAKRIDFFLDTLYNEARTYSCEKRPDLLEILPLYQEGKT